MTQSGQVVMKKPQMKRVSMESLIVEVRNSANGWIAERIRDWVSGVEDWVRDFQKASKSGKEVKNWENLKDWKNRKRNYDSYLKGVPIRGKKTKWSGKILEKMY